MDVSDGNDKYEGLGTRDSVFEKVPTDSIYISKAHEIVITAQRDARVVICYSPCEQERATHLFRQQKILSKIEVNIPNKRHVHNILPDSHTASGKNY
ncbi:5-deoxy-glucuronate isomerase [Staphylococcus gallinarum]|uniref:5-deoxy-glucuronate isomerase n=1 Tax=Staphylococcus gallinarum TaxID=1293 RepID=A0A380FAB6_STAGA|nr:5-deoxy-glucuronate isomerase [Staphylococcus gallinarum]